MRSFFGNRTIALIVIASLFAILIPAANIYYILPSFKRTIIENAEIEADRITRFLVDEFLIEGKLPKEIKSLDKQIQKLKQPLNLFKIRWFSPNGTIVYSTKIEEIGFQNTNSYFSDIVASGHKFTKVVEKGVEKTQEGKSLAIDVVETYVPVMAADKFIGAFELYYDITGRLKRLNKVISHVSLGTFAGIVVWLIFANLFVLRERESVVLPEKQLSFIYRSPYLPPVIIGILIFAAEGLVMLILSGWPELSIVSEMFLDATLLLMMLAPALYFFMFRPLLKHIVERREAEKEIEAAKNLAEKVNEKLTQEITDREIAEKILQETAERLELSLKGADLGTWEYFNSIDKYTLNQRAIEILGKDIKNESEWLSILHPDDLERMVGHESKIKASKYKSSFFQSEYRIISKNGDVKWLFDHGKSFAWNENGYITRSTGIIQDITKRKNAETEKETLIIDLKKALSEVKTLSGLLPICSHCKKIRDDKGYWKQIELYIRENSQAEFSHGICQECSDELYGEEDWYLEFKNEE